LHHENFNFEKDPEKGGGLVVWGVWASLGGKKNKEWILRGKKPCPFQKLLKGEEKRN